MNEDWEELLLKTRSAINREKYLASVTSRQKMADAALKPAFYVGKDPHSNQELVQINGGNPIVAKSVTNGQIKPGDAVQPIHSLGFYGINALPHIPLKEVEEEAPKIKKGDGRFKVLFSKVKDGIRTFYVGGHTKKPVKAFSIPVAQLPYGIAGAFVGNSGMGKYDFIIDYLYDTGILDTSTTPPGYIVLKGYYAVGQEGFKEAYAFNASFCGYGFWGGGFMNTNTENQTWQPAKNNQIITNHSGVFRGNDGSGSDSNTASSSSKIKRSSIFKGVANIGSTLIEATESGADSNNYSSLIVFNSNYTTSDNCTFNRSGTITTRFEVSPNVVKQLIFSLSESGTMSMTRTGTFLGYYTSDGPGQPLYNIIESKKTHSKAGNQLGTWDGSGFQIHKNELKCRRSIYYVKTRTLQKSSPYYQETTNTKINSQYDTLQCLVGYNAAFLASYVGTPFLKPGSWWISDNDPGVVTIDEKFYLSNEMTDEMIYDKAILSEEAYQIIINPSSQLILTKDNISRIFLSTVDNNAIISADSTGTAKVWNVSEGMVKENDRTGLVYSLKLSPTDNYTIHHVSYYPEDAI